MTIKVENAFYARHISKSAISSFFEWDEILCV